MSTVYQTSGSLETPVTTALATDTETDIYAPPDAKIRATVIGISVANVDTSNACRVTLRWSDGTSSFVFFTDSVPAGETITLTAGLPMLLNTQAADGNGVAKKVTAQAATAGDLVVTVIASVSTQQQVNR